MARRSGGITARDPRLLERVAELLRRWSGEGRDPDEAVLTRKDLRRLLRGEGDDLQSLSAEFRRSTQSEASREEVFSDAAAPTTPSGVKATGTFRQVIVDWDRPSYVGHKTTEVWRNTDDELGNASLITNSSSNPYADSDVELGKDYYYWVRHVNERDEKGPFHATDGEKAGPGLIGGEDLSDLIITASKIDTEAVEAEKIANAAVGNAAIENAAVSNAKIEDAAVDKAKVADAAIVEAKIGDAEVTNAKIGNTIESDDFKAGSDGWRIRKDGDAELNNATFRGELKAASGTFEGSLTADAVDAIDTINVAGNAITVPSSTFTSGTKSQGDGDWMTVQTLTYDDPTGAPVNVWVAANAYYEVEASADSGEYISITSKLYCRVLINGSTFIGETYLGQADVGRTSGSTVTARAYLCIPFKHTPSEGESTKYELQIKGGSDISPSLDIKDTDYELGAEKRSIVALEVKR